MLIDIISDTVCPWCFIGKRRFEQALARSGISDVQIGWRPFQLNPDIPEEGMDRREYLRAKFGGDGSGGTMYEAIRAAGHDLDIPFAFSEIARQPNTVKSHRLIRYAGQRDAQDAVVERLFLAYFAEGKDIGDTTVLAETAAAAGLDADAVREFLDSDSDRAEVLAEDRFAREMGVQGVPCFIIDRRYAVSGAQDPDTFIKVFEAVQQQAEAAEGSAPRT